MMTISICSWSHSLELLRFQRPQHLSASKTMPVSTSVWWRSGVLTELAALIFLRTWETRLTTGMLQDPNAMTSRQATNGLKVSWRLMTRLNSLSVSTMIIISSVRGNMDLLVLSARNWAWSVSHRLVDMVPLLTQADVSLWFTEDLFSQL